MDVDIQYYDHVFIEVIQSLLITNVLLMNIDRNISP